MFIFLPELHALITNLTLVNVFKMRSTRATRRWCASRCAFCSNWYSPRIWSVRLWCRSTGNCCPCSMLSRYAIVRKKSDSILALIWHKICCSELWRSHRLWPEEQHELGRSDRRDAAGAGATRRWGCVYQHQVYGAHLRVVLFKLRREVSKSSLLLHILT